MGKYNKKNISDYICKAKAKISKIDFTRAEQLVSLLNEQDCEFIKDINLSFSDHLVYSSIDFIFYNESTGVSAEIILTDSHNKIVCKDIVPGLLHEEQQKLWAKKYEYQLSDFTDEGIENIKLIYSIMRKEMIDTSKKKVLDSEQIRELVFNVFVKFSEKQIFEVWNTHFPEKANKLLLGPFRFICDNINWAEYLLKCYHISNKREDLYDVLLQLSRLFFKLYKFNSKDEDKIKRYALCMLEEESQDSEGGITESLSDLVELIPSDRLVKYIISRGWADELRVDNVYFLFNKLRLRK